MSETWIDAIGILAGICTTAAILPQLVKAWKTKEVKDVSAGMFVVLISGVGLWTYYGILKNDLAIILFNGISVALNVVMLYILVRYNGKKNRQN